MRSNAASDRYARLNPNSQQSRDTAGKYTSGGRYTAAVPVLRHGAPVRRN